MKKTIAAILSLILLISAAMVFAEEEESFGTYKILNMKKPPEFLTERKLSDDQILELADVSLDDLKKEISTFGDFAALVRIVLLSSLQFIQNTTSNEYNQYTFGAVFSYLWLQSWFSPNMTVSIAQYVLEDDYPDIRTVCVFQKNGSDLMMKCANGIPADGGYYLVNAESFAGADQQTLTASCALDHALFVSDLSGLVPYYNEIHPWSRVTQILSLDTADEIVLDPGDGIYIPQSTLHITIVFFDENAKYPSPDSRLMFTSFGFPKQINTESGIDATTARKLSKGTYEEAAKEIKTIPDVLNYLYYCGHSQYGFDQRVMMHDGEWHYNYKPQVVFRRGKGNCGGISGLIAGLLEGDYDEVGMIVLRFPSDGHVINYVKDKDQYYVFDANNWVGCGHEGSALCFSTGRTLKEAAMGYGEKTNTRQMAAFINPRGGDIPVIFDGNATILPSNYVEVTILQETPEEGYVYHLIEVDQEILDAIDAIRSVW